jgi:hypothetical protein
MKKLIPFLAVLVGATGAFAQVVNFNNSVLVEPPDRTVYMSDMITPVRGSTTTAPATFVAQLYYGAVGASESSLTPVTAAAARFRPVGTGDGLWLGGNRTLTGFQVGDIVTLQVRAWDAGGIGRTYAEARQLNLYGDSATFTYKVAPGTAVPSDAYMYGFTSFSLVPEPSVIGLGLIGIGALFMLRRRKA